MIGEEPCWRGSSEPRSRGGLPRGGAGAAARARDRPGGRDVARPSAGAPGGLRSARQRVGVGERPGRAGAPVPLCLAPVLGAGAPAAAERRPCRAGAEDGVARRDAGAGVRAAGVPGTVGGDDAAAGNQPAHLPVEPQVRPVPAPARPAMSRSRCSTNRRAYVPRVLAPRARWCERVVAYGRVEPEPTASTAPLAPGPDDTGGKPTPRAWSWAALMHRAFAIDALACPHGGRLRLIGTLHDPAVIRKILAHVGIAPSGRSPGRAPTYAARGRRAR